MSRKAQLNYVLEENKSLSSSFVTNPTVVTFLDNLSYQINVTTSDSQGVFVVQASNDYDVGLPAGIENLGQWFDLVLSGVPTVNLANDTIAISMNQVPFKAVRLSYTANTPGTGVCKIIIQDKMLG